MTDPSNTYAALSGVKPAGDTRTTMREVCHEIASRHTMSDAERALDESLAQARNDALEEAARVCDGVENSNMHIDSLVSLVAHNLARRIRALKSQESG